MDAATLDNVAGETVAFEDAIVLAGHGKFHYLLTLVCGFCLASLSAESSCVALLLPSAACDFNMTLNDKGLLGSIAVIGIISSCYLWGYLSDIFGRRKVLIIGLSADFICAVASSFAHTFWLFLLLRFFNGFSVSVTTHTTYAYAAEFYSTSRRTGALMMLPAFMPLGRTILTGLSWLIIPNTWYLELPLYTYNPWRLFVIIMGIPSIMSVILLALCLPESPKFLLAQGKEMEALEVLRRIYRINKGNPPSSYPVKSVMINVSSDISVSKTLIIQNKSFIQVLKNIKKLTVPLFVPPYLRTTAIACIVLCGLNCCINGIGLWINDIFNYLAEFYIRYSRNSDSICETIVDVNSVYSLKSSLNASSVIEILQEQISVPTTDLPVSEKQCNIISDETFLNSLLFVIYGFLATVLGRYIVVMSGRKNIVYGAVLISVGCAAGLHYSTTSLMVLILSSTFMYSLFVGFGAINSTVVDIYPTQLRATAVSVIQMSGNIGMVFGSLMMGLILDLNCNIVFIVLGVISVFSGVLTWFLPKPPKEVL